MASKIQIGTTLDVRDWIELNEYLNEKKTLNAANIECLKMARRIKDGKIV